MMTRTLHLSRTTALALFAALAALVLLGFLLELAEGQ
jgi:hypothetical protein